MATLTKSRDYSVERADSRLHYLIRAWSCMPEQAIEWEEWDDEDRFDFELDWPVVEMDLNSLKRWHGEGLLTEDQRERYEELMRLVTAYRPLLDRMFSEPARTAK